MAVKAPDVQGIQNGVFVQTQEASRTYHDVPQSGLHLARAVGRVGEGVWRWGGSEAAQEGAKGQRFGSLEWWCSNHPNVLEEDKGRPAWLLLLLLAWATSDARWVRLLVTLCTARSSECERGMQLTVVCVSVGHPCCKSTGETMARAGAKSWRRRSRGRAARSKAHQI